jgi:CHAD domain-containing protein
MPAIEDLRALLDRQLRELERSEPGVRAGGEPEDLHRFRVATRRSRALIRASRPILRDQLANLDRELRWLGVASGPVRDLDVLIEHLSGLVDDLDPDRAGIETIVAALERERLRQQEELVKAIDTDRYRELISRFESALPGLAPADDVDVSVTDLAQKEYERLAEAYHGLGEDPTDEDLHAVRIRAKHVRYSAELAARSEGPPLAAVARAARDLQDLIGAHQDAVVAEERIRALAGEESRLAAGRIVEVERRRRADSRAGLSLTWRQLERAAKKGFRGSQAA